MGKSFSKFRKKKSSKEPIESSKEPTGSVVVGPYQTDILSLPDEIILFLFSFLSPKDLASCSRTCRTLRVLAYDPSLWREIHASHWAKALKVKVLIEKEHVCETRTEQFNPHILPFKVGTNYTIMKVEEKKGDDFKDGLYMKVPVRLVATTHQYLTYRSKTLINNIQVPMKLFGCGVKVLNFSYSNYLTEELFNNIIKLCPNVEEIYLRSLNLERGAFERVWDFGAAKKLSTLFLVNCKNLDDLAFLNLIRCWAKNDEEFKKLDLSEEKKALCCGSPKQGDFEQMVTLEEEPNGNCDDEDILSRNSHRVENDNQSMKLDLTEEEKTLCCRSIKQGNFEQLDTLEEGINDNCEAEDILLWNNHLTKCIGLKKLDLSGCRKLTGKCLFYLALSPNVTNYLEEINLTGCRSIIGSQMRWFVKKCHKLEESKLAYCSHIHNGNSSEASEDCYRGLCSTLADM